MKVPEICSELQALQRKRAWLMKSHNKVANRTRALVAGINGYETKMTEGERKKQFTVATKQMSRIKKGEHVDEIPDRQLVLVLAGLESSEVFQRPLKAIEKEMVKLAKQLPVADWVEKPEQRGFGILFLAIVIGETGDLYNYANPGKVWRRLGCAPFESGGEMLMGATWRGRMKGNRGHKLHASEWEEFGYVSRRRAVAYLIGNGIVKQNTMPSNGSLPPVRELGDDDDLDDSEVLDAAGDGIRETDRHFAGPYRARYDFTKALIQVKHPDYSKMRCHLHGMLLATKMLLKNMWMEWNQRDGEWPFETDKADAVLADSVH